MCIGILNLFFLNDQGVIFVTTGKQILPIREELTEVKGGYDWENVIYPLVSILCGRKVAKCIDYANLQITEVENGSNGNKNKRNFIAKIYLPQLVVRAELFSKTSGLILVKEEDLKMIISKGYVMRSGNMIEAVKCGISRAFKRKEVRFEAVHKEMFLQAFPNCSILDKASPFEGVIFLYFNFIKTVVL